jgi:hypothetical protein
MISLELLTQFSHESLRYRENVKVLYYTLNKFSGDEGVDIYLRFNIGGGEFIKQTRYEDWLQTRRDEKISQILN